MKTALQQLIKLARKQKNISLVSLSQKSGIPYTTLNRLENGGIEEPSPTLLKKVAPPLDIDYLYLMKVAGYLPKEPHENTSSLPSVPLLSWDDVPDMLIKTPAPAIIATQFVTTAHENPDSLFALHVPNNKLAPAFCKGETLIIEKTAALTADAYCLFLDSTHTLHIMKYKKIEKSEVLMYLDPALADSYITFKKNMDGTVIGRIVGKKYFES